MLAVATTAQARTYLVWQEHGNDGTLLTVGYDATKCARAVEGCPECPGAELGAGNDWTNNLLLTGKAAMLCVVNHPDLVNGDRISLIVNRDGSLTYYTDVFDTATMTIQSGFVGAPVTIQAYQGNYGRVILRPPDGSSAIALRTTNSYVMFRNLVIDAALQTGSTPPCVLSGGANHITLDNVDIKNSPAQGCLDSGAGGSNTFRRSRFHNNVGDGLKSSSSTNTFSDNEFYSNGGDGLDTSGANTSDSHTIERNRSYSNTGCGFVLGDNAGGNSSLGRNNLSYANGTCGVELRGTSNDWSNNVSYGNTGTGIKVDAGATNSLVKNDIAYSNGTNITDAGTTSTLTTNQTSNPLFNNAAGGDFTLADASTARNAGTTLATVPMDFRKYPRAIGSAYDIGAYEMPDGCANWSDAADVVVDTTCRVSGGLTAHLQIALFTAKCGERIEITDGEEYDDAVLVLPSKNPCTTPTTLTRSGALPAIYDALGGCYIQGPTQAAEIAQIDACKAAMQAQYETNAPKLTTTTAQAEANAGAIMALAFEADYWTISGIHFRSTNTHTGDFALTGTLLSIGFDGADATPINYGYRGESAWIQTQQPDHILIDRVVFSSVGSTVHAIYGEGSNIEFINSLCYGIKVSIGETDSQCYIAGQSPGPYRIENNFLEAAGENVLFGGTGTLFYGMLPADIIETRNVMTKDWTWWTLASRVGKVFGGVAYTVKNVTECKSCQRAHISYNLIENAWYVNRGNLTLFQAVSQGEGAFWYATNQVELDHNVLRHGGMGFVVAGKGGQNGGAEQVHDLNAHHNLMYDITFDYPFNIAYANSAGVCFSVFSNSTIGFTHDPLDAFKYNHNTCDNTGTAGEIYAVSTDRYSNFEMKDNLFRARGGGGAWDFVGINIQSGINGLAASLDLMAPGSYTVTNNAMFTAANNSGWPAGNWIVTLPAEGSLALWDAVFVDRSTSNYTVAVGSEYKALGAKDATDNTDLGADMSTIPGGGSSPEPPAPTTAPIRLRFHASLFGGEDPPAAAFGRVVIPPARQVRHDARIVAMHNDRRVRDRDRRDGTLDNSPALSVGVDREPVQMAQLAMIKRIIPRRIGVQRQQHLVSPSAIPGHEADREQGERRGFWVRDHPRLGEVIARAHEGPAVPFIKGLERERREAASDQVVVEGIEAHDLAGQRERHGDAGIHAEPIREEAAGEDIARIPPQPVIGTVGATIQDKVVLRERRDARDPLARAARTRLERRPSDPREVVIGDEREAMIPMQIGDRLRGWQRREERPWGDDDRVGQPQRRPPQHRQQHGHSHGADVRTTHTVADAWTVPAQTACQTNTGAYFYDFGQTWGGN